MDAIKKKMEKLSNETLEAEIIIQKYEAVKTNNEVEADRFEEQLRILQKKIQAMEGSYDVSFEELFNQTVKLEAKEKKAGMAEGEVSGLRSKQILLQERAEKHEERLAKAVTDLASNSQRADVSVKRRHDLENGVSSNEEQIDSLEKQLKDAQFVNGESERKYEDISRKMATLDADAQRGNERADAAENKIMDIEEELKVVGQSLQLLEVAEEKSRLREEQLQTQILELRMKLKASEYRGENADMNIQRINVRIDQIEEDLMGEKLKIKKTSDELNSVFDDMINQKV